ncbi:MAG: hypothetical protein RIR12_1547 [Bacteroidota bacterium]|jgi:hypothetical protein
MNKFSCAKVAWRADAQGQPKKTKRLRHKHKATAQGYHLFRFLLVFLSAMLRDAHKIYLLCKSILVSVPAAIQAFAHLLRRSFISSCSFHLMVIVAISAGRHSLPSISQVLRFIAFHVVVAFGVIHQVFASFQHCPFRGFAEKKKPHQTGEAIS